MNFRIAREVFVISTRGRVLSRLTLFADTRMLLNLKTSLQVGETVWPSTPSSTHTSKASVEDLYFISLDLKPTSWFFFFRPELFRFESLLQNDNRTNLDHAFNVANEEFSVPKLLDPAGERVLLPFTFLFTLLGH